MARVEDRLPKICSKADHQWARISVHGCGTGASDQAVDEAMVLVDYVSVAELGCICNNCFQVYGQVDGTRNSALVAAYLALAAW